jgi:aspartyl protease family protein
MGIVLPCPIVGTLKKRAARGNQDGCMPGMRQAIRLYAPGLAATMLGLYRDNGRRMNRGGWIWFLVVAVGAGIVMMAAHLGLGTFNDNDRLLQVLYFCVILAALSVGVAARLQARPGTAISHIGAWFVIFAGLILVYSYRDQFSTLRTRFVAELVPAQGQQTGPQSVVFPLSEDGHFHVNATVDGHDISFLVDTGASDIVLTPDDARAIGLDPDGLSYTNPAMTANGTVMGAPVQINRLTVGPIEEMEIPATVNRAPMPVSLLGMEFLRRLRSWRVEDGRLTLEQ